MPRHLVRWCNGVGSTAIQERSMATKVRRPRREDETFLGYRIRKVDGLYIAVPLEWAGEQGETLVASDLATLREEIRRWWYQVGE